MKKRILALALAGTTAFSVFGAAMSANAAPVASSTHEEYGYDYYVPYTPAGDLSWTDATNAATVGDAECAYFVKEGVKPATGTTYIPLSATIYLTSANSGYATSFKNAGYTVEILDGENDETGKKADDGYFEALDDFMAARDYTRKGTVGAGGAVTLGGTTYYVGYNTSAADDDASATHRIFTEDQWTVHNGHGWAAADTGLWLYVPDEIVKRNGTLNISGYHDVIASSYTSNGDGTHGLNSAIVAEMDAYSKETGNPCYIKELSDLNYVEYTNLVSKAKTEAVITSKAYSDNGFSNGQDYFTLDATDPTDFDAVMDNPVNPAAKEIYMYDYYGNMPYQITADMFAEAWADDEAGHLMHVYTGDVSGVLEYDRGTYDTKGIRAEVMDAWEDFLAELGILNLSPDGLTRWAKDLIENYSYQYYDGLVVIDYEPAADGSYTVTYSEGKKLDIYNFGGLIADILELAPVSASYNAQTSQLVYLMQQYEKYMDGYVDPVPVDTNDWGDLLVSLAQAPTAEEFATSNGYKQYTKAVDILVSNYENASTSSELKTTEADLYEFVTSYYTSYKYESKPTTTALSAAIDSTYYNYKWSGTSYTNDNGTPKKTTDDLTVAAGYYVGAYEKYGVLYDGSKAAANVTDTNLTPVALYPVGDYSGSVTDGAYPGVGTGVYGVSQEYNWFYNVYALAYDVLGNNKYQSTIDLMATTLEEAIDALVPTTSATAADVIGAEEQNDKIADLVETDYKAAMWANRNKIYNYITERVSNDETGHYGATNAEILAKEAAYYMGWQNYQTTVTRSEINSVSTAKTEAQNALTALRNDEENYNAAQANALEKAIEDCDVIIDLYNGDYSKSAKSQSVNAELALQVGDKDQILKSDITGAIQAVEDAINFKNIIQGWTKTENGWMYGVEDTYDSALTWGVEDTLEGPHYLNFGWAKIGNTWFYFDDEGIAKESDWLQVGNDWYYFNKNCGAAIGWAKVDDQWYYFNQGCKMMTGWQKVDGNWYYLKPSGAMATGWCQVDGKWYYLSTASNSLGQMYYSTTTPDGYKVDASGALVE